MFDDKKITYRAVPADCWRPPDDDPSSRFVQLTSDKLLNRLFVIDPLSPSSRVALWALMTLLLGWLLLMWAQLLYPLLVKSQQQK